MVNEGFSKKLMDKFGNVIFDYLQESYIDKIVCYAINSNYRKAVNLKSWIKEQVENPTYLVKKVIQDIGINKDPDIQIMNILKWVHKNITYKSDSSVWKMAEYWQTAEETSIKGTGDCEDGAILIYVLARLSGIASQRLLIFAGDVVGGGHCWLGYRPTCYPLNFCFMDWCYWYSSKVIPSRDKFLINGKDIQGDENYIKMWFAFNEDKSITKWKLI